MKRMILTAGLACAMATAGLASAQTAGAAGQRPAKPSGAANTQKMAGGAVAAADRAFVMEAARGGMAEVELGKLAADKAASADVKQFGQRMVDDHSKANDELKAWASQKNVTLPADMDAKQKALHHRLSGLSGAAFDRAYMNDMVADHNHDVAAFTRESKMAKDADLKAWAGKTLPTLQEHQKMAKDIHAKLGTGAKPSAKAKK
jgi:putative membrane protein